MSIPFEQKRVGLQIKPPERNPFELDYRLLIIGNFCGALTGEDREDLRDRTIHSIGNKRDLDKVIETISPRIRLTVPNKLSGDNDWHLEIDLTFK